MKVGETVKINGKRYLVEANIPQILTGKPSCIGCALHTGADPGSGEMPYCISWRNADSICGKTTSPADQQFIFKELP